MPKVLRVNKGTEECARDFLKFLLESGKIRGVITLRKMDDSGGVGYSLVTDPAALEEAVPLFPFLPVNAAQVLSRLTFVEPAAEPVAVLVRPCELRAFTELIKRSQGSMENFLLISFTCGGTYPMEMAINETIEEKLPQYWDAAKNGEIAPEIRAACMSCEHFEPYNADITFALIGNKEVANQCEMYLNTDKAEQFIDGFEGKPVEGEIKSEATRNLRSKRQAKKQELFAELGIDSLDMRKIFEKCIGCHNCSKVCPVCYCRVCFFDSGGDKHAPTYYEAELEKMGYASILPDPIFYQLVRLFHVSTSCVGCGICADSCPVNIPLWAVSLKTGGQVQEAYGYLPGENIETPLPITAFKPEEFAGVAE